jgi:hypothetical protein
VHQPLTGDGSIQTEIQRLNVDNTTLRAGVMIRENTNSASPFVAVLYVPNQGVKMAWRDVSGGTAVLQDAAALDSPAWVRLSRHGNEFVGEYSLDGIAWTELGRHTAALDASTRIGLAVAARGTADARVFFGNLSLSLGAAAGDIDGDGAVDLVDFGILKEHFGALTASRNDGDLSGDGSVNLDDFGILKTNFSPSALTGLLTQQLLPSPGASSSAEEVLRSSDAVTAQAVVGLAFAAWEADDEHNR